MQSLRTLSTALILAALLAVITGCAARETATERDFGKSVRTMIDRQTLNPAEAMLPDPQPVDHGNGDRLNSALEVYKGDVSTPPGAKQVNR